MNWFNDVLTAILDAVQSVDPVLRTLLAGVGIFLETSVLVGLIVPGDTIVIVAATAVDGPVEYLALVTAVIAGALGGESVGFALGRFFGPKIRHSRLGRRIGERNWVRAENYIDRRGGIAVFISRFLPVLHSLVPVTVGMSTMRYRRFIAWTAPASVIWAFAYVSVGAFAAGSYRQLSQQLHGAGYVFVAIIVVFLVAVVVIKKLLERSEARHWSRPGDGDANTLEEPDDPSDRAQPDRHTT
ncbi:DedA family protein [Protaetiibacter intestinalis]|uniref:DedA family protein n=1 Tax=Protaetiibacter intestinalis TaxID=2419774 RepID=A0A387B3K8_9MICO|nr:DedA family protein [Protaetiibacter intestinalis]AYF96887.1 DedA family protein [Protaetiibacter intestinalis]